MNKHKDKLRSVRESRIEQEMMPVTDSLGRDNLMKVDGKYPNATARDIRHWLKLSEEKWGLWEREGQKIALQKMQT